jgi:hypothetical protein
MVDMRNYTKIPDVIHIAFPILPLISLKIKLFTKNGSVAIITAILCGWHNKSPCAGNSSVRRRDSTLKPDIINPMSLKSELARALIRYKKVALAARPVDVKFDETSALFLADTDATPVAEIGDRISLSNIPHWYVPGASIARIHGHWNHAIYAIAGFFELTGKIKDSGIQVRDIFCALVNTKIYLETRDSGVRFLCPSVVKSEGLYFVDGQQRILLFWPRELEHAGNNP